MTLIAKWSNGVQREFKNLNELNVLTTKAELNEWCEKNRFQKPVFEIIAEPVIITAERITT